jgi:putative addiction module killer protein
MEHPVTIKIYVTVQGRAPFTEWLHRIEDARSRAVIRARLNRIRLDNFGDCHSVGDGVHEFRIDYGPGYRIYFGRLGAKMILLLCAGTKRGQQKDIERAKLYWKAYMEES